MKTSEPYKCYDPLNTECSRIIEHPIFIEYYPTWDANKGYIQATRTMCMKCFNELNRRHREGIYIPQKNKCTPIIYE